MAFINTDIFIKDEIFIHLEKDYDYEKYILREIYTLYIKMNFCPIPIKISEALTWKNISELNFVAPTYEVDKHSLLNALDKISNEVLYAGILNYSMFNKFMLSFRGTR